MPITEKQWNTGKNAVTDSVLDFLTKKFPSAYSKREIVAAMKNYKIDNSNLDTTLNKSVQAVLMELVNAENLEKNRVNRIEYFRIIR